MATSKHGAAIGFLPLLPIGIGVREFVGTESGSPKPMSGAAFFLGAVVLGAVLYVYLAGAETTSDAGTSPQADFVYVNAMGAICLGVIESTGGEPLVGAGLAAVGTVLAVVNAVARIGGGSLDSPHVTRFFQCYASAALFGGLILVTDTGRFFGATSGLGAGLAAVGGVTTWFLGRVEG